MEKKVEVEKEMRDEWEKADSSSHCFGQDKKKKKEVVSETVAADEMEAVSLHRQQNQE